MKLIDVEKMKTIREEQVLEALRTVRDAERGGDIVSLGMVSGLRVGEQGDVFFLIEVDPARGSKLEPLRQDAERAVAALAGVGKVSSVLTAEGDGQNVANKDKSTQKGAGFWSSMRSRKAGGGAAVSAKTPANPRAPGAQVDPHNMAKNPPLSVPARNIIVVASGKGGVGKSTVSANIASYMANKSRLCGGDKSAGAHPLRVGLLDADIYGPSMPAMMGCESFRPETDRNGKLVPVQRHGLKVMSIGFMVDQGQALIWRGPMVQSALYQMFRDVAWADVDAQGREVPLDYLIVDMPPGTGDVQLTLAQKIPVTGAVIVSTPQDIALLDARRAVEMFRKTGVPVLGVVENMSTYICPSCGHEEHIFGHGGAEAEAKKLGVPFLGTVPLAPDIRLKSDNGTPVSLGDPRGASAKSFSVIAENIARVV